MTITFPTLWHLMGAMIVLALTFRLLDIGLELVFALVAELVSTAGATLGAIALIASLMYVGYLIQ